MYFYDLNLRSHGVGCWADVELQVAEILQTESCSMYRYKIYDKFQLNDINKQGISKIWPSDLLFELTWPIFNLS